MVYLIYGMIYLGSFLMVFNIFGFIRFTRMVSKRERWEKGKAILNIPVLLLIMFLLGYLIVGIFGKPDIVMSGILFGGSIFVFIMYILLGRITQKIIENEQLETKLMVTQESNRAKTEFLSGISHEMRTPLNAIIGLDKMALNEDDLTDSTRDYLEKINLSAKHMLGLVNNILDMNSMETGSFAINDEEFALCDAIGQVNVIAETMCKEKDLTYICSHSEDVCGSYIGDEMRIKQILLSLLDNAVKFTDAPGKGELNIKKSVDTTVGDVLVFTVKDTGIGIDDEFLPNIFGVFTKEDASTTSSYGGTGIGLAVTKSVTNLLGGTITATSIKGVGSAFVVTLPLTPVEVTDDAATAVTESLEGRRILVVEDIPVNAEIVMDLLELEDAITEHAENGKIAVDMFNASPIDYYDAILMDLRMPVMDGLTATKRIRALNREDAKTVPIIALTANAFSSDVRECLDVGMNAHLAKPADSDQLYETLKIAISRSLRTKGA